MARLARRRVGYSCASDLSIVALGLDRWWLLPIVVWKHRDGIPDLMPVVAQLRSRRELSCLGIVDLRGAEAAVVPAQAGAADHEHPAIW